MGAMLVGGTYDKRGCSMRLVGMLVDTYGLDEYAPEYPLGAMPLDTYGLDEYAPEYPMGAMPLDTYGLDEYAPEYPMGAMPFGAAYDIDNGC